MFDKRDLVHLKNLQKLMGKCKIELEGPEILAAADVIRWIGILEQKLNHLVKEKEAMEMAAKGEEKIEEPKKESAPESLQEKPKRSKAVKTEQKVE